MPTKTKLVKPDQPFGWIPLAVLYDDELSLKAKGLWCYINSKPNGWEFAMSRIAAETKEGVDGIRACITELEEHGLLKRQRLGNGHMVYKLIDVLEKPTEPPLEKPTVGKTHSGKIQRISNKEYKVIKNISNKEYNVTNVTLGEIAKNEYGDPQINECFKLWHEITGLEIKGRVTANRRACHNLIRSYKVEGVTRLIRAVEMADRDRYAPSIADFVDLQAKLNSLLKWAKKQGSAKSSRRMVAVEDY